MKRLVGAAAGLALFAGAGAALADEEITGVIEDLDAEQMRLVLTTGEAFELAEGLDLAALSEGSEVRVVYEEANGTLRATQVELIAAPEDEGEAD